MLRSGFVHLCARTGRTIVDAVLPPLCLACGEIVETTGGLCGACWPGFSFIAAPQCAQCGLPFGDSASAGALCAACSLRPPRYRRARAALAYNERSRRLVLPLKHGDRTDMARAAGAWMARAGAPLLAEADIVAPVPLHWRRLLMRRYNQAQLLARATLAAAPAAVRARLVPDLLHRRRWTGSQGGLDGAERRANVARAFAVDPRWSGTLSGKSVLLVDDVLTTGATVEACARTLQRAGARSVDVLTLARVVRAAV